MNARLNPPLSASLSPVDDQGASRVSHARNAIDSLSRRQLLKAGGALVVSFAIPLAVDAQAPPADPRFQMLDSWVAIAADGKVTLFCGKVELGTGIQTAMGQIVADELDVAFSRVSVVMGDTQRCLHQGPTVGSLTLYRAGPQIRQACAEARHTLLQIAATRLSAPADTLTVQDGVVSGSDGKRVSYVELVGGKRFDQKFSGQGKPKAAAAHKVIGQPVPRVELPAKVFGTHEYVQNLRMPGLLHGRVVRPAVFGASPVLVDEASVKNLPGNVRVVLRGNFVGVVAEREEQAIRAARALKVEWGFAPVLPDYKDMPAIVRTTPAEIRSVANTGNVDSALAGAAKRVSAEYDTPFQQHASIGPSCAIADVRADRATLWSPTQASWLTRDSIADVLGMKNSTVNLVWVEGSGCYGHNGADDCTADAALLSQAVGKPVRLQWMRHDEAQYEPKGPAMGFAMQAALDAQGNIVAWDNRVYSPNHSSRPSGGAGGNTLAGLDTGKRIDVGVVGADRNARHSYVFPNNRVTLHLLNGSPLRASALRGLGSPQNTFANESFIDELAAAAAADPIAFRLKHLKDPRAIAVLEEVRRISGWTERRSDKKGQGRGAAFAQYDNYSGYVGMVIDVVVDRSSGKLRVPKVYVAHDCGQIVNPDGLRNQIEGCVVQTLSRAMSEEVRFNRQGQSTIDWVSYPLMRFPDVPDDIVISLINRPELPSLGAGEPAASPVFAALANAIFDATGARLRRVPFLPERVKAALV